MEEADRYRYTCPNGHISWDRTNNHGWCPKCAIASEQGFDADPEFYAIYDKKLDRSIPYEDVEFVHSIAR